MTALGVKQALVVAVAISILTFSYFKTQTVDPARHNQVVVRLGELKQLDAMLNQDILQARSQLFHNYDPLGATVIRQRELLRSLEHGHFAIYGNGQADIDRRFEAYSKLQVERVEILERFKSKNAILKNSLSYLPVAAAELEARAREVGDHEAFADALDELVRGVLLYSLSGDEQLWSHLRSRVRNIMKISAKLPRERRLQAENVMAHASIALKSRGQVDGLIQKLMSMPAATLGDDLYRAYIDNFARMQASANQYRVPMYAISVGLLVYILYVLGKLKSASITLGQANESLNERSTELAQTNEQLRGEVTERKQAEEEIARKSALLETTFESMSQGIIVYDKDLRITDFNQNYIDFCDFPADLIRVGMPLDEIIRFRARRGDYGPVADVETTVREHLAVRWQGEANRSERILSDGRVIAVSRDPMPNGGYVATFTDITERKRAEREIARQKALLEKTFENMSQGVSVYDADLKLVAFNQNFIDLLGLPPDFVRLGCSFEEILRIRHERGEFGEARFEHIFRERVEVLRRGKPWRSESVLPGGAVVALRVNPMPDGGFITTITDVTERKKAEQALAEQSAFLDKTFKNMPQGVSVYDADLKLVAFNQNYVDLWRFPPGFVRLGMTFEEISRFKAERGDYGPGEVETLVKESVAAMWDAKALQPEYTAPDGNVFVVWRAPMPGGGIINTFTDITERKRAEEALRESEEWYALTAAGANDGLWDWNILTNESYFSPRWKQIRGFEDHELENVRQTFTDALHPDDRDHVMAAVRTHLDARVPYDIEFRLRHKDGHYVWARSKGQAIWDEQGNARRMAGSISDITPRRQAAEKMREAKEQAELANRAKSEFLANMSHELRTPLNAILGFSELMGNATLGPLGNAKYEEYAKDINDSGRHLLGLIQDILDLSKIEAGRLELDEEDIDVARTIRSCLVLVKERARNGGVTLKTDIPEGLPALHADKRKLKQILVNLLSNAVKFTPASGTVTIRTWFRTDDGYVFQVADTGIGIALEDIPKALAPFRQIDSDLNRKYEGTGLGLPLTKSFVEMHGGSLDLQSEIDIGTTVTIRFPAERIIAGEDATEIAEPAKAEPAVDVAERGIR